MKRMAPLEKIYFTNENNQDISAIYYDKIGNSIKRRFLLFNFTINVKLNFKNKKLYIQQMLSKIKPSITFHIIDDILNKANNFSLELGLYGYKKLI